MFRFLLLCVFFLSSTSSAFDYSKWEPTDPPKGKSGGALERWASINSGNYIYMIRESCGFCRPSYLTKVVVVNNKVVFAEPLRWMIPSEKKLPLDDYKTIDGLYGLIDEHIKKDPDEYERDIDYQLHYPRKFSVDPSLNSMDDEYYFEIIELVFIKQKNA